LVQEKNIENKDVLFIGMEGVAVYASICSCNLSGGWDLENDLRFGAKIRIMSAIRKRDKTTVRACVVPRTANQDSNHSCPFGSGSGLDRSNTYHVHGLARAGS
jgi:hypothetical protein